MQKLDKWMLGFEEHGCKSAEIKRQTRQENMRTHEKNRTRIKITPNRKHPPSERDAEGSRRISHCNSALWRWRSDDQTRSRCARPLTKTASLIHLPCRPKVLSHFFHFVQIPHSSPRRRKKPHGSGAGPGACWEFAVALLNEQRMNKHWWRVATTT